MGQMEMKCIFNIGGNISICGKVTQVSDVAHGPLVLIIHLIFSNSRHILLPACTFYPPLFVSTTNTLACFNSLQLGKHSFRMAVNTSQGSILVHRENYKVLRVSLTIGIGINLD